MSGDKAPVWEPILIVELMGERVAALVVVMRKPAKPITQSANVLLIKNGALLPKNVYARVAISMIAKGQLMLLHNQEIHVMINTAHAIVQRDLNGMRRAACALAAARIGAR